MEDMKLLIAALATVALLSGADQKLGKPLTLKEPLTVSALMAHPDDYVGKTVQVKGKISAVCQEMGCWMELQGDGEKKIRVKVEDGVIVFPKDSAGSLAIAEGKLSKTATSYQIEGDGAVILEK
jgi:hypothetical protein